MLNKYEWVISEMGKKARGKTDTFDSSSEYGSQKNHQGLRGHSVVDRWWCSFAVATGPIS